MTTKKLLLGGALVVVVVVLAVFAHRKSAPEAPGVENGETDVMVTREPTPQNITVPEPDATNAPTNVAVPEWTAPAGPSRDGDIRFFAIKADHQSFSPDTVIIHKGDTVHIQIQAIDQNYDFTQPDYGYSVPIPKGTTKDIEWSASAEGSFTFFCATCENKDIKGKVIVAK